MLSKDFVFSHLQRHGRDPRWRVWNVPDEEDSSDEEWRENLELSDAGRRTIGQTHDAPIHSHIEAEGPHGVDVHTLVQEIFQSLDTFHDDIQQDVERDFPAANGEEAAYDFDIGEGPHDDEGMFGSPQEVREATNPLYAGSKCSKLAFVVMFLNICGNHNVPNNCVSELLTFLHKSVLPESNVVPKNMYEARRLMSKLGLNYNSIHACPDGHVLFRGEYADCLACPQCGKHRYRNLGKSTQPTKVLRHFPLIPRLQRMYRCSAISEMMTWTSENKSSDGLQRHIGDSPHWKFIDEKWPEFAADPRNVRLGLSLDGFNPFGDKNNVYSCWPVTLLNYNLPPWMTTKRFFVILGLLIPGPTSAHSGNIDVWLAPLVEELKILWERGILTYDVIQRLGLPNPFNLKGQCILTSADYPAHGMISGQVYSGYLGCTGCGPNVTSEYSKALRSVKFQGHRRYLPANHPYRQRHSHISLFNKKPERRSPPKRVTAVEILHWGAKKAEYDRLGAIPDGETDPAKMYGVKRQTLMDLELEYWRVCRFPLIFRLLFFNFLVVGMSALEFAAYTITVAL